MIYRVRFICVTYCDDTYHVLTHKVQDAAYMFTYVTYMYTCQKVHNLNFAKDNFDDNIDEPVNDNDMENEQCECS